MVNERVIIAWVFIIVGWFIGMITSALILTTPISSWANKQRLENKQTITQSTYYAQYSAVRRFPR